MEMRSPSSSSGARGAASRGGSCIPQWLGVSLRGSLFWKRSNGVWLLQQLCWKNGPRAEAP